MKPCAFAACDRAAKRFHDGKGYCQAHHRQALRGVELRPINVRRPRAARPHPSEVGVDEWRLSFTLEVDTGMFTLPLVRQLIDDAGKRIGLGDFRPARKGPFGRFVVVEWAVPK